MCTNTTVPEIGAIENIYNVLIASAAVVVQVIADAVMRRMLKICPSG